MLRANTKSYEEFRAYLNKVPVIETHEHYIGVVKPVEDILGFVLDNYYNSDLLSAAFGMEKKASSTF